MRALVVIVIIMNLLSFISDKYSKTTSAISLVLLSIVIYNAQKYSDLINYERYFNDAFSNSIVSRERGFFYLTKFIQLFTSEFNTYRTILFCFGFLTMCCAAFNYGDNISLFLIGYTSYFFFLDGEQLRNFISISIVAYSMKWILQEEKKSTLKYIIGIVIASSIHSMAIVYVLFIFAKYDYIDMRNEKEYKKVIVGFAILFSVILFLIFRYSSFLNALFISLGSNIGGISDRMSFYLSTTTHLGWIIPSSLYILSLITIAFTIRELGNNSTFVTSRRAYYQNKTIIISDCVLFDKSILERLLFVNIIGLLFVPLCVVNLTFYRIGKNIVLLDFMLFPQLYKCLSAKDFNKAILFIIVFIVSLIGWCYFDYQLYGTWDLFEQMYFSV